MIGTKRVHTLKRVSLRILISLLLKDEMVITHQIPSDLILEILTWLPAKSVLRFKCVCKEWYNLIDSPLFVKLHLNKFLEPNSRHHRILFCPETLDIVHDIYHPLKCTKLNWPKDIIIRRYDIKDVVGSCNGLVCFKVSEWNEGEPNYTVRCFLICNPTTRTFKSILPCSEKIWTDYSLSYGFGYDSEHDDYKIVVTSRVWTESDRDVRIFSLKADLWIYPTPISPTEVSSGRIWENRENVIFKDKMLHYLVSAKIVGDGSSGVYRNFRIARYDVVSEKWRDDLDFPFQSTNHPRLGELDGQLCVGFYPTDFGCWKNMVHGRRCLIFLEIISCIVLLVVRRTDAIVYCLKIIIVTAGN